LCQGWHRAAQVAIEGREEATRRVDLFTKVGMWLEEMKSNKALSPDGEDGAGGGTPARASPAGRDARRAQFKAAAAAGVGVGESCGYASLGVTPAATPRVEERWDLTSPAVVSLVDAAAAAAEAAGAGAWGASGVHGGGGGGAGGGGGVGGGGGGGFTTPRRNVYHSSHMEPVTPQRRVPALRGVAEVGSCTHCTIPATSSNAF